ncbi:Hypothetical Protein OBI_RACECAR_290 [Arthrobacter phage Racecar]|nr:hypothetical protein PBI_RACECAR_82 [Arthrobacter phage Racecar]
MITNDILLGATLRTSFLGTIMQSNPFAPQPPDEAVPENNSPNAGKNSAAEQGLEIPMGWKPTVNEPIPVVRCTGTSSTTGQRCKKWSLRGSDKCTRHGAQLPNVREHADAVVESARLRIFGLADEAVDVLEELLKPGTSEAIRLKAAENILNRGGIKEAMEIKVEHSNASAVEEISKRLNVMRERIEAANAEEEEILDAEEVDEVESEDGQETADREDRDEDS